MTTTHQSYQPGDTIAAIATPPGEGGVAIIRISGPNALAIANRLFSGPLFDYPSHTAHFGKILDLQGQVIDSGLALVLRTPRSYTGEETVEFHCHGGVLISRKVLQATLAAGARAALPGEFTFQAFMNGKIDLTQAEAVQTLIAARSERAWQVAEAQLAGKLRDKVAQLQQHLVDLTALFEAWVDFPEEGLEFQTEEEVNDQLEMLIQEIDALSATFYEGKRLQTGFALCLLGPPNAGKSSLMNALLQTERAIVTEIAGTTRDLIEADLSLNGWPLHLIDTAGLRATEEVIEKEGIKRSHQAAAEADLILAVIDVTRLKAGQELLATLPPEKTMIVWNKIDLPHQDLPLCDFPYQAAISAKRQEGLTELKQTIVRALGQGKGSSKEEVVLCSQRHFSALQEALQCIKQAQAGLQAGRSPEFLAADSRLALRSLSAIIGMDITEDVLSAIFSTFCVGK